MKNIIYCTGTCCPFTDCERHPRHLKGKKFRETVSVADFCGTCRRYIGWLVDHVEGG